MTIPANAPYAVTRYCKGEYQRSPAKRKPNKIVRESTTTFAAGSDVVSYPHVAVKNYSKWNSATYTNQFKNFTPQEFRKKTPPFDPTSTGIWLPHIPDREEGLTEWGKLVGHIFKKNQNTYDRPTDYDEGEDPKKIGSLPDLTTLIVEGDKKEHNEVMLRLRWDPRTWNICIFTDELESRLLAQIQANDLTRRLHKLNNQKRLQLPPKFDLEEDYTIPICFYKAFGDNLRGAEHRQYHPYDYHRQCFDRVTQDKRSDLSKGYQRFLTLELENFSTVNQSDLTLEMLTLINSLSCETQEAFLLKYIDNMSKEKRKTTLPPFFHLARIESRLLLEVLITEGFTDFSKTLFSPELDLRDIDFTRITVDPKNLCYLNFEGTNALFTTEQRTALERHRKEHGVAFEKKGTSRRVDTEAGAGAGAGGTYGARREILTKNQAPMPDSTLDASPHRFSHPFYYTLPSISNITPGYCFS